MLMWVSDGLVAKAQSYRPLLASFLLALHLVVLALLVSNEVPSTNLTLSVSSSFDYSCLQLVRDMYLAQAILLAFEVHALWRGAHSRRFLHLGGSVTTHLTYFPVDDVPLSAARPMKPLQLQSGFLMQSVQSSALDPSDVAVPLHIYVDEIEVRQMDSIAVNLIGAKHGRKMVAILEGHWGRVGEILIFAMAYVTLLMLPVINLGLLPADLPLLCIIPVCLLPVLRVPMLSRPLVVLLVRRRQFIIQAVFIGTWLVLLCLTLRDEKAALAIFIAECAILDYLADASVASPIELQLAAVRDKVHVFVMLAIMSCFLVWGVVHTKQNFVIFRPDLDNGTVNAHAPFVVDIKQVRGFSTRRRLTCGQ